MKRLACMLLCLLWSHSSFAADPLVIPELVEANFPLQNNILVVKDATNKLPVTVDDDFSRVIYNTRCENAAGCLVRGKDFTVAITLPPGTSGLSVGSTGSYQAQCGISSQGCLYFGVGNTLPLDYQAFATGISEILYNSSPLPEARTMYFSIRNSTVSDIFITQITFNYINSLTISY